MASCPGSEQGSRVTTAKIKIKEVEVDKTHHNDCLSTNVNIFNQVCQGLFDISKKSL